ncbi:MAG: hypothetical protein QOD70_2711 [Frankiales bacterium]|nr:hypothetical protein [Frankiales bacterium]
MTTWLRVVVAAVLLVHGLIHLLGAAKGLGWAQVAQLKEPISSAGGWAWLAAAAAVVLTSALLATARSGWWVAAAVAALLSQAVIVTSWSDAKAGSAANVLLVVVATYGFAAYGPTSYTAQWQRGASQALAEAGERSGQVTESDLAALPAPLAAYVRRSGAVGAPRVNSYYATFHGRIRSRADQPWMSFSAQQVSTYGASPSRYFLMGATRGGLPVAVLHEFTDGAASMRGKILSLLPIMNASGAEMDRGETVTLFNDLVVLAPAAIVDAPATWSVASASSVRGSFTNGSQTVSATLVFDQDHALIDFISDDRLRASPNASSFTRQRWSTPIAGYRQFGGRHVAGLAEAHWHAPSPEGEFSYVELTLDHITYNPVCAGTKATFTRVGQVTSAGASRVLATASTSR